MLYLDALLIGLALAVFVRAPLLGLAFLGMITSFILFRATRKRDESLTPQNDVELWIFGTYANWALYNCEYDGSSTLLQPNYKTVPILLGGRLGPYNSPDQRQYFLDMLDSPWDIHTKKELLETVEYMSRGPGFRNCRTKADHAWELCRCNQLLAIAFRLGWISRSEMVKRSCAVGRLIQQTFSGWQEMSESFLESAMEWMGSERGKDLRRSIHKALWLRPDSPYNLPWDLHLP